MSSLRKIHDRREFFQRSLYGIASFGALSSGQFEKPNFDRGKIFTSLKKGSNLKKIGIIICARYESCGGGKCLRSVKEHVGGFSRYPEDISLDVVGFGQCGGCPGVNVEYVPEEMKKNGAEVIHLAT